MISEAYKEIVDRLGKRISIQSLVIEYARIEYKKTMETIADIIFTKAGSNSISIILDVCVEEAIDTMTSYEKQRLNNLCKPSKFKEEMFSLLLQEFIKDGFTPAKDENGKTIIKIDIKALQDLLEKGELGNGSAIVAAQEGLESWEDTIRKCVGNSNALTDAPQKTYKSNG